ncbi:WD repeat-containing protein [Stagonosporopsis vannaccii]|nr:WD repeat-containing protein [Stagonosporopsis vannaccii]
MAAAAGPATAYESQTFDRSVSIAVDDDIGAASISPAGRDVVLASRTGLRILDLDNLYTPPLFISNQSSWDVADVQWSPFAARAEWIASTRNQLALVYNLSMAHNSKKPPIEYTLRAHDRAITDINFSAHHPDLLATCGIDSFVFIHDLRSQRTPLKLADFTAGATQVKWNRQNDKIIASAHDKHLHIWDVRKGATPITTISAHSTKIYGIDWNRSDPSKILTCSLDSTIKLWNQVGKTATTSTPRRIIHTNYPIWRARHAPFPHGLIAMPQRGNSSLWLYKHVNDSNRDTFTNEPVHEFRAHKPEAQVREFLWRVRGGTDDHIDDREFQLVSWGTDRYLHLHRVSPEFLEKSVGFRKGEPRLEAPNLMRRGAAYVTYRDGPIPTQTTNAKGEITSPRVPPKGNLSTLLQNYSIHNDVFSTRHAGDIRSQTIIETQTARETMTAVPIRRNKSRVVTQIKWMDGVKFGGQHDKIDELPTRTEEKDHDDKPSSQEQADLGAEISQVGSKYKKLDFENIDVPNRILTVTFNGPWGDYDQTTDEVKLVFLRLTIKFPTEYPKAIETETDVGPIRTTTPLDVEFEKTTAAIPKENQNELIERIHQIAEACADQEREALEAILSYALGERGFNDSLHLPEDHHSSDELDNLQGNESSSEDDENEGEFTNDAMQSSHTNANVPLPVQCSVRFSASGSLVVARVPLVRIPPLLTASPFRMTRNLQHGPAKDDIFASFGRFTTQHAEDSDDASSPGSSEASWESSSSPSSASDSEPAVEAHLGTFQPPMIWQRAGTRFQSRNSLPSSSGTGKPAARNRFIVSILSAAVEDLVPSKRSLAEQYRIFGPGPEVCQHNADVAKKLGMDDLSDIWMLCKLILSNEVPLEILPQQHRKEQVVVLARRALVRIKRKDSGLDLQFDEADTVTHPRLRGRIKWGNHAVVTWLIPALFDHFERLADTQMLAMLSCIFAEPAAREGVTSAMAKMRQSHLPMSMTAPAFSLDYFASPEIAWSLFNPTISVPSTPSHSRFATPVNEFGWQRLAKDLDTYGSHSSSNGPWGSDTIASDPVATFSSDNTPPVLSRASTTRNAHTATHTPYSASPEQSHSNMKRTSTANFASAVAALSRPFANAMSASPPVRSRIDDLSTSAPTSGVTWGTTTFYGSESQDRSTLAPARIKHHKRASFVETERVNVEDLYDSDVEDDKPIDNGVAAYDGSSEHRSSETRLEGDSSIPGGKIRVTLKNQDQFDDESCLSRPLLDMSKDWLYRAWREQYAEMLSGWGLIRTRAEVLKFNGLVSYFPAEESRSSSKAASLHLALKKGIIDEEDHATSRQRSRTSTTLMPPSPMPEPRSPFASARQFSFNPEATAFEPGQSALTQPEDPAAPTDVLIASENYLRLSIPAPTPSKEYDENIAGLGTSPGRASLHPRQGSKHGRPSLSRGTSNVSGSSLLIGGRAPSIVPMSAASKPSAADPVYCCSICWIKVSGRFRLCPSCGHVAHFDCIDDDLGMEEGECVVGCGCGCGFEIEDERTRMEAYIDEVRAATASGVTWEDGDAWMQLIPPDSEVATPSIFSDNSMFEGFNWGRGVSKIAAAGNDKRKDKPSGRGTISPTPTAAKKKKGKKKVRASGLSYY